MVLIATAMKAPPGGADGLGDSEAVIRGPLCGILLMKNMTKVHSIWNIPISKDVQYQLHIMP